MSNALSPDQFWSPELKRFRGGYDREDVDRLIVQMSTNYGRVWQERGELRERVEQLENELAQFRESERVLRETLLAAQRAADQMISQAKEEGERLLGNARSEADALKRDAMGEKQRLEHEITRLRAINDELHASLRKLLLDGLELLEREDREIEQALAVSVRAGAEGGHGEEAPATPDGPVAAGEDE